MLSIHIHTNRMTVKFLFSYQVRKFNYRKAKPKAKNTGTRLALQHFDDFYKSIFVKDWNSVRLGLLCPSKYVALVNNFGDADRTVEFLQCLGAVNIKELFEVKRNKIESGESKYLEHRILNTQEEVMEEHGSKVDVTSEKSTSGANVNNVEELNQEYLMKVNHNDDTDNNNLSSSKLYENRLIDPNTGIDSPSMFEFIPATELTGADENFITESNHFKSIQLGDEFETKIVMQYNLEYPENLKVFSFGSGDFSKFPQPDLCKSNVYNYYLFGGASILPVLALDLKPEDKVLDMCASPGGKSLAILQTLLPEYLVCNDISVSRSRRVENTLKQFIYDYESKGSSRILITIEDGCSIQDIGFYNKILVDVPCTTDRHSLQEPLNNIFQQNRIRERLRLPEIQCALLINALKLVSPGGVVVYSTCTISPIQNDGVVHRALCYMRNTYQMNFTVIDMKPALMETSDLFHYGDKLGFKYGVVVVPFLPLNFGPTYFCKIVKN